jgi:hypothetical protein
MRLADDPAHPGWTGGTELTGVRSVVVAASLRQGASRRLGGAPAQAPARTSEVDRAAR